MPAHGSRKWQHARTLATFLLFGSLTTTLLAWAFAVLGSTPVNVGAPAGSNGPRFVEPGESASWPLPVPEDWPSPKVIYERTGRGLRLVMASSLVGRTTPDAPPSEARTFYRVAGSQCGWPLPALHATSWSIHSDDADHTHRTPSLGLPRWVLDFAEPRTYGYSAERSLPLSPLWRGFLIDTALYALGFWLVLRLWPLARRLIRARRHQCLACGYPIGTNVVCTECGATIGAATRSHPA